MSGLARAGWLLVTVVLAAGAVSGVARGLGGRPNWGSLQAEATYVWQHHETAPGTAMFGYLPAAVFALWPCMTWLPQPLGLLLYVAGNVMAVLISVFVVWRWWRDGAMLKGSFAWPVLLVSVNFANVIQANQLTLWALMLCVAGIALTERRRGLFGGVLLGMAGLVKSLPFLLVGYLVCRRRWRAVAGMVVAVALFDLLPSVVFFGWERAVEEHRLWLRRARWHSSFRQIDDPCLLGVYDHRSNASLASVLARWLRGIPDADELVVLAGDVPAEEVARRRESLQPRQCLIITPMPPSGGGWKEVRMPLVEVPRLHLAQWSTATVSLIWLGLVVGGLTALASATWRGGRGRAETAWAPPAALWVLAMLWVTPMMRHYYLALAFPAVAVVWRRLGAELEQGDGRWTVGRAVAAAALVSWLAGLAGLGWHAGRWYGLHLGVVAFLAAATAWAWRRAALTGDPDRCTPAASPS